MPGLHWHIPFPIETVDLVNINEVSNYAYRNEMLTADEQYVFIDMVVQYRRTDPIKFSFNVVDHGRYCKTRSTAMAPGIIRVRA
jgi:membrane protease subunit HflK